MRAKRLILHLGDSKTGSTAIQKALRASQAALDAAGVLFPDPGRHDNHQLLFPHLHGVLPDDPVQMDSLGGNPAKARAEAARRWADLKAQVNRAAPDTIVLSCENQFRPYDTEALARLEAHANEIAEKTHVFAYLRSPASFFLSYAQQSLKKRPEIRVLSPSRYRDTLEPLATRFPVSVARAGRDALRGGDAVTDFCARFLPNVPADALIRETDAVNETVSAEAMVLLQAIFRESRPLPAGFRRNKKALRRIVMACDGQVAGATRPSLHDAVRTAVETRQTDLGWLQDRFGLTFPDLGPRDMDTAEAIRLHDALRDVADLCPVDHDRVETLWAAVQHSAAASLSPIARLRARFTG